MLNRIVNIGIIELDYHADNLLELIEIFNLKFQSDLISIDLIVKKDVYEIIKDSVFKIKNVKTKVYDNEYSHHYCLNDCQPILNKCNLVFINTISKSVKAFSILCHKNIILRVHNANKQFAPMQHIDWSISWSNLVLLSKFFVKEVLLNKYFNSINKININVKYFAFSDIEMLQHARDSYSLVTKNNSVYIPLKYYRKINLKPFQESQNQINISIIGRIDDETRDIQLLADVFYNISVHFLKKKVLVKFIGTGYKKPMIKLQNKLSDLTNDDLSFKYNFENVSQDVIVDFIKKSDIIISPLKLNCKVGIFLETYGKTKVSGNFSDIAISPQPVFMPANYIDSDGNNSEFSTFYQDSNDLSLKLLKCINDHDYLNILQKHATAEATKRYGSLTILNHLSAIELNEH